jgi:hypothetical protein
VGDGFLYVGAHPRGRWTFFVGAHPCGRWTFFVGAHPRGRWFSGRVPRPSPTGVGSNKKNFARDEKLAIKKPAEAGSYWTRPDQL